MTLTDEVKGQAVEALEEAKVRAKGLLERLRIWSWSLSDLAELWKRTRQAPFLSLAEPVTFDMNAAKVSGEDGDDNLIAFNRH